MKRRTFARLGLAALLALLAAEGLLRVGAALAHRERGDADVAVLDLRQVFAERVARGEALRLSDGHWSSACHALAAGEIARERTARGGLR